MDPRDFKSLLRQTVVLPVALVGVLAAVLLWQITYMSRAFNEEQHTQHIATVARQFLRLALDMETGARGYLLTGDRAFLEPYHKSEPAIEPLLTELRTMVAYDPISSVQVREMDARFREWKEVTEKLVAAGPQSQLATDKQLILRGKQLMDSIRSSREILLNQIETESHNRAERIQKVTRQTLLLLLVLSAMVAAALALMIRRGTASLIQTYVRHLDAERRNAAAASEAREWLMTTLRSMREAVLAIDNAQKVTFMNPAAENLTGVRVDEALWQEVNDILRLEDEDTHQPISVAAGETETQTASGLLRRRDAQMLYVEFSASPIRSGSGFAGTVFILRDVSERRRSEAALRSSERLSLLGRLSATIAHEIRNPLDAVMNLIYLLRTSATIDDNNRNFAVTAEEELQRIAQITHQLLAFNREARHPQETDVAELVSGVIKLFAPKLSAAGVTVQQDLKSTTPVIALPGELRQVFSNLVANALDVLPSGGVLSVRVADAREHGLRQREGVRIVIADNGPGIPDSVLSSLFTPFFTTKGEKGTGLGLWVTRGIITKHEGTLRLRSNTQGPRHGTVFSIFLPRHPESRALQNSAA